MRADPDGFDKFVHSSLPRLVLYVVKLGATKEEAEDVVAEALTEAYLAWPTIVTPDAWVRTVATRIHFRSARRERAGLARFVAAFRRDEPAGIPFDEMDPCGAEFTEVLRQLRRLPRKQRLVLALVYDGFSTTEMAEITGLSEATVRSNLRHARRRLRADLPPRSTAASRSRGGRE